MPCIITIVSFSDRWGLRSRCHALAKLRVHRPNRVSMMRMRVVAWSHVSPDNVMQQYRLGPPAVCNNTAIPDSWYCSSGCRASGNNPTPIPRSRLATPCVPTFLPIACPAYDDHQGCLPLWEHLRFPGLCQYLARDSPVLQIRSTRAELRQCQLFGLGIPS